VGRSLKYPKVNINRSIAQRIASTKAVKENAFVLTVERLSLVIYHLLKDIALDDVGAEHE